MTTFTEDGTPVTEPTVDNILQQRKATYGDYSTNAKVTQGIMKVIRMGENVNALNDMHLEGLHMIAHKMSRIVNGDPNHKDSWDDIAGYAKCVADRISVKP